ncbi:DUF2225 domain-containing protein [Eubacteriales bacterium OttesenSCG-928-N14]|nr:DUF2225 domain-containing protein [Eubacteriales bacterium OttesenSCG-928-N14]
MNTIDLNAMDLLLGADLIKRFDKGSVIVREGGDGHALHILIRGSAVAYRSQAGKPGAMGILTDGGYFGEFALFGSQPYNATVIALEDCRVMVVDRDHASLFADAGPQVLLAIAGHTIGKLGQDAQENWDKLQPMPVIEKQEQVELPSLAEQLKEELKTRGDSAIQPPIKTPPKMQLFPAGHSEACQLPMEQMQPEYLYEKSYTCPLCKTAFKQPTVRASKLVHAHTDADMRTHYVGIEPLYYDVLTCPNCQYSALHEVFDTAISKDAPRVNAALEPYANSYTLKLGTDRDSETVFASYYLALLCAPECFSNHQMQTSKLWLKLSRVYHDSGNAAMERDAAEHALADYLYVYERSQMPPAQQQQLNLMLAELYYQLGDIVNARRFFFMVKTEKEGSNALKKQADDRIETIREQEQGR